MVDMLNHVYKSYLHGIVIENSKTLRKKRGPKNRTIELLNLVDDCETVLDPRP